MSEEPEATHTNGGAPADSIEATMGVAEDESAEATQEIDRLRTELQEANDKHLRALAEFDNTRKRLRADYAATLQYANAELIRDLLPVLDNLERALAMDTSDGSGLRGGVELTARLFSESLARFGVTPIAATGQPFDPSRHEAIAQVESVEHPEGVVVEELQRGYVLHDRVLRPSRVKVSSGISTA